jgi:hypothetical protein
VIAYGFCKIADELTGSKPNVASQILAIFRNFTMMTFLSVYDSVLNWIETNTRDHEAIVKRALEFITVISRFNAFIPRLVKLQVRHTFRRVISSHDTFRRCADAIEVNIKYCLQVAKQRTRTS